MSIAISCKNVKQIVPSSEGDLTILKDTFLEVAEGQSIAIIGQSGSGKSTLLGLLAGLDQASSGDIEIFGNNISKMNEEGRALIRKDYISFIFQNFQLLPTLTALENVLLPLQLKQVDNAKAKALEFLEKVGLGHRVHHTPKLLSGGEQQRVAIARAFACQTPILFADEPTGNLDSQTGQTVADLLFELNEQFNLTLVLVTHDPKLANRCDKQFSMNAGELIEVKVGEAL
ncbi:ABC transporter ATP-binding protein [Marinicellulosiphila megalodicopiae]|uniref:ABC transporter ATP-binding protein n=1 Tax=Marinicellulosiphila megalodicopiae TaxID=2724896 RepID=UPI003BB1708F